MLGQGKGQCIVHLGVETSTYCVGSYSASKGVVNCHVIYFYAKWLSVQMHMQTREHSMELTSEMHRV